MTDTVTLLQEISLLSLASVCQSKTVWYNIHSPYTQAWDIIGTIVNRLTVHISLCSFTQGQIQDFHWGGGGGGRKRLCASMHITSAEPNSLSAGVPLIKGPWSSRVVLMSSRAIWAFFFKYFDKKLDLKNIVDQILGPPPPPWIRHWFT